MAKLCPTVETPWTVCSLPGSSVHGILQASILEYVAISFSRGSSQPRDQTQVSRIAGGFFAIWVTREALIIFNWRIIALHSCVGFCQISM